MKLLILLYLLLYSLLGFVAMDKVDKFFYQNNTKNEIEIEKIIARRNVK